MTKLIGIKELQINTRKIREEAMKGVHFIVLYRSQPIFEIKPIQNPTQFAVSLKESKIYKDDFIRRMEEAEKDIKHGRTKEYSTETFLKSL